MARGIGTLTAMAVEKEKIPGRYADGGGLYLQVGPTGSKAWIYRYQLGGQRREMGLGPVATLKLAEARTAAGDCRKQVTNGIDPLDARREADRIAALDRAKTMTFKSCAEAYIEAHEPSWRNPKHCQQWKNTLDAYAYPLIGALSVAQIDTGLVMKIIEPIWSSKTETASRLRGRIEAILDWARVRGYRTGENPARWRGHLDQLLPKRAKVQRVEHHAALPYSKVSDFVAGLQKLDGVSALAFEFLILTATRTSETLGAMWSEIDLEQKIWTIPADRIKAGREHKIPLSPRALVILAKAKKLKPDNAKDAFVFPGIRTGKGLAGMALLALLRRIERTDITPHGFRSTFRDWAAERTNFPRDVAEMALAHAIGDKVEAAYRRGDLFEKRRRMMDAWATFCATKQEANNVVGLRQALTSS